MGSASPQFFSYGAAHGVYAVSQYTEVIGMASAANRVEGMITGAKISMATCLGDNPTAVKESGG
jgi:hypothetical protein